MRSRIALVVLFTLASLPTFGRVISYSPYTNQAAAPAHQHRMNRHFALVEGITNWDGGGIGTVPPMPNRGMSLVLYDFQGEEEPGVVFPREGTAAIYGAAVRESGSGLPSLLTLADTGNNNGFYLSTDGGSTWKLLAIPAQNWIQSLPTGNDVGGPFAAARLSQIRIGTDRWPFVVSTRAAVYGIRDDGFVRALLTQPAESNVALVGTDRTGRHVIAVTPTSVEVIDIEAGTVRRAANANGGIIDAWMTADGSIYAEERGNGIAVVFLQAGVRTVLRDTAGTNRHVFAVPTHDYEGAWIIDRGPGTPTSLYRHDAASGLVKQWDDVTAPEVEALHTGSSGQKLLVQVHRPRPQAQRIFIDPALAVWRVGDPAPRQYDELYMNEEWNKGFVHLDVEKIEAGEPFVFDSGLNFIGADVGDVSPSPPSSGGGDVVQEWGVVRASLKQRLVLPAVGRTRGAFESNWRTDVILYNPLDSEQSLDIRFAPSGAPASIAEHQVRTVTLEPKEIRLIEDVMLSLFGIESALGAFFIEPEAGVTVTSRTYTKKEDGGTYGFGMYATDVYAAAASARFPLTFAGGFLGNGFRTNMIITDAGESGAEANVRGAGALGLLGFANIHFTVSPAGQQQINEIGPMLGVYPHETGGLIFRPTRGSATAALFAIDNKTNDPTYFPPDLPAPVVRTIPAIGHVDGVNDSHFRTDLYLHNPSSHVANVTLQIRMWHAPDVAVLNFTMLPREARVIPDALVTLFGRTGIARLRYQSNFGDQNGVRVTSRTYSVNDEGGTYGFLMPPLNNFQSGTAGDTLEILGAVADGQFRTNIGLVELNGVGNGPPANTRVEIIDAQGRVADAFTVPVPFGGGMQINDVFRTRALSVTGPVLIRVSPLAGLVGAYATHIDNRTNDASYLSANLGAK